MSKWRKAFWAGVGAAATALATGLATETPKTQPGWIALFGAAVAAGLTVGLATYSVPNEPAVVATPARPGPAKAL